MPWLCSLRDFLTEKGDQVEAEKKEKKSMFKAKNTPHFTFISLRHNNGELERNVLKIVVNLHNCHFVHFKDVV